MSASGRVCEITNGRFVEAKHEKRWLAVRLLRSNPAGRFGSSTAGRPGGTGVWVLVECRRRRLVRSASVDGFCNAPAGPLWILHG